MLPDERERRHKPRVKGPIPAKVYAKAMSGESFEFRTLFDNLSVSGLHVRFAHPVAVASPLTVIIRVAGIKVNANGVVQRIQLEPDGSFGVGVAFDGYRVVSDPAQANDEKRSAL